MDHEVLEMFWELRFEDVCVSPTYLVCLLLILLYQSSSSDAPQYRHSCMAFHRSPEKENLQLLTALTCLPIRYLFNGPIEEDGPIPHGDRASEDSCGTFWFFWDPFGMQGQDDPSNMVIALVDSLWSCNTNSFFGVGHSTNLVPSWGPLPLWETTTYLHYAMVVAHDHFALVFSVGLHCTVLNHLFHVKHFVVDSLLQSAIQWLLVTAFSLAAVVCAAKSSFALSTACWRLAWFLAV